MKNILSVSFLLFFVISNLSCTKNDNGGCTPKSPQSEQADIVTFASTNGMTATAHSSGIYYEVINPGGGITPAPGSKIFVKYTGKLINGTTFDSQSDESKTGWILGNLIAGWQIGIPLIKKGGSIKLIIPSSLAYGCVLVGTIPANSVLYFEVELVDVQ